MAGQTLNDRLTAAKHALAGQGLARVVCKATTEELIGPKKKHLDYLLHCTNEPNVSIPQLANLLIERTQQTSWVIVFKALITVHHLMCYGNERFTQYLASSNCTFQLGNFLDKCGVQGYDMSTFIRRYAKYLNEKAVTYRTVAFDFCKVKRGKEDGTLRTMNTDKLIRTLPILQNQLDALLEFDCSSNDLTNGVVNSCFMLLFRDLIRLFACYNDGIINLLEKYFDMNKKNARDALDIYKKFLIRMDRVAEFLKVAENVGIDKGDIPDLTKFAENSIHFPAFSTNAPSSLLDALEQHLATLEGRKGSQGSATRNNDFQLAVSVLCSTSNAFGNAGTNGTSQEVNGIKVDDTTRKAVEEEAAIMNQHKFENESPLLWEQPAWDDSERRMKELTTGDLTSPPTGSSKTNPFLASPAVEQPPQMNASSASPSSNQGIIDLFSTTTAQANAGSGNASDDLLCLSGNPFADSLFSTPNQQPPQQQQQAQQPPQQAFQSFGTNGFTTSTGPANSGMFASESSFAAAFGNNTSATASQGSVANNSGPGFDAFGDMLQPQANKATPTGEKGGPGGGFLKGDLDSTLANLASNLDMNGPKQALRKPTGGHQWGSPKPPAKTGGTTWAGPIAGAAPGMGWTGSPQHGFQPMGAGGQWNATGGGMMAGPFPQQPGVPGMMNQQPFGMTGMRPMAPGNMGMNMGMAGPQSVPQANMYGNMAQQPMMPAANAAPPTQVSSVNDPFGAL